MKRFRAVLVGCGQMANTWVTYASSRPDTEIVGVVDINPQSAAAMIARHGLTCGAYPSLTDAIRSQNANLVFDVTAPAAHEGVALEALANGCDILAEKPLAASLEAARRVVDAAARAGRTHAVMQNRRYLRDARALREVVQGGAIGALGMLSADFFLGPHFTGFRDAMPSPLLLDMAIHTFDSARFLSGADAVSVYCHEFNPRGSWYAGNAAAVCIFEMSDGTVFSYRGSWCAEGLPTSWEAEWRATGSAGTAVWNGAESPRAEAVRNLHQPGFTRDTVSLELPTQYSEREGHDGCLDEMFAGLLEGRAPETSGTDNINSLAMVFGALESTRLRQRVQIV